MSEVPFETEVIRARPVSLPATVVHAARHGSRSTGRERKGCEGENERGAPLGRPSRRIDLRAQDLEMSQKRMLNAASSVELMPRTLLRPTAIMFPCQ